MCTYVSFITGFTFRCRIDAVSNIFIYQSDQSATVRLADAKVYKTNGFVWQDQDILRFDVPMYHVFNLTRPYPAENLFK